MKSCEYLRKCLYGSQVFKGNDQIIGIYKKLFCEAGESKITSCKRYQVIKESGICPTHILPNTKSPVEKIIGEALSESKSNFARL